ncbi:hypothetical protein AWB73_02445 [Caballeronia turbans]|jgi:hypothetical protein|nr:hypothetical protein AWB73_02445 [Caballeronia turbans]
MNGPSEWGLAPWPFVLGACMAFCHLPSSCSQGGWPSIHGCEPLLRGLENASGHPLIWKEMPGSKEP